MLVHKDYSHLWSNIGGQLVLAALISCSKARGKRRPNVSYWVAVQTMLVYLASGYAGAVVFEQWPYFSHSDEDKALIGGSAGVFGLCGLVVADVVADTVEVMTRHDSCLVGLIATRCFVAALFIVSDLIKLTRDYNVLLNLAARRRHLESLVVHFAGLATGFSITIVCHALKAVHTQLTKANNYYTSHSEENAVE